MARTYLPTLIKLVRVLCLYITRNREKIRENLSPEQRAAFDALADACQTFLDLMGVIEPNP